MWKVIWLWDNTAKRNIKRHRAHWAALVLGCIWLFVLHTRFNRAFRSVFGLFLIIFQKFFASFVPKLHFLSKNERQNWWFSDNFSDICALFVSDLKCRESWRFFFFVRNGPYPLPAENNFESPPRELQCSDRAQPSTTGSGRPSCVDVLSVLAYSTRRKRWVRKQTKISQIHVYIYLGTE